MGNEIEYILLQPVLESVDNNLNQILSSKTSETFFIYFPEQGFSWETDCSRLILCPYSSGYRSVGAAWELQDCSKSGLWHQARDWDWVVDR
jgi:hypothetical protein